jgi:hypothetical protein
MASDKQLRANRENGKKGRGPKTIHGKEISCQNSIKHGLLCKNLKFGSADDEAEFAELIASIRKGLHVVDDYERHLADNLAADLWKQRKLLELEQRELLRRKKMPQVLRDVVQSAEGEYSDSETVTTGLNLSYAAGECQSLSFTFASEESEESKDVGGLTMPPVKPKATRRTADITCRLTNALPTLIRYNSSIKHDMQRCLALLRQWRQLRRERHVI